MPVDLPPSIDPPAPGPGLTPRFATSTIHLSRGPPKRAGLYGRADAARDGASVPAPDLRSIVTQVSHIKAATSSMRARDGMGAREACRAIGIGDVLSRVKKLAERVVVQLANKTAVLMPPAAAAGR